MNDTTNTTSGISLTKFAEQCGVSVAAVTNWRARFDDFPPAIDPTAHRLKYEQRQLVQWAQRHGKLAPSVTRRKRRLFDHVQDELRSVAPDATSLDVLAASAVIVLQAAITDPDVIETPLLVPANAVADLLNPEFRETQTSTLRGAFSARPADEVRATIDALRKDFVFNSRTGAWGEDVELAQVAVDLGGQADAVIDPCCGIGNSLCFAARDLPAGTALVGRDIDPLRVAVTAALLRAEGFTPDLSVGDAFDTKFTRACREVEGDVLVVATPPADPDETRKRKATKKWITLLTSTVRQPGDRTTTVLTTPAAWLTRTFLERGDERRALLDADRVDAALLLNAAAGGRRSEIGITRLVGPRTETPDASILLADLSYVPPDQLRQTVAELVGPWDTERVVIDRFAKVAQMATSAEALAIGALVPRRFRDGLASSANDRTARERVSSRPTTATSVGSGEVDPPSSNKAAATQGDTPARFRPLERPEPFDVPTEALEKFLSSAARPGTSLPPRQSDTPTMHDVVRRGDLQVFGAITGQQHDDTEDLVELITGNKGFGMVRQVSPQRVDRSDQRRGAVYIAPTPQGIGNGITVEFVQAWFASAEVQAELWTTARAGRHRLSVSVHDILDVRADFPVSDECARIAAEWTEIREVQRFAMRLNAMVRYRREHLLDHAPD